jgi:AbrB family looped-hinge helix DNA binding protein
MRTTAKVGKSGRAQIPFEVREKMGISEGDRLVIEIEQVIKN